MNTNYYLKFIDFFQRHNLYNEELFHYFRNNSILFDYLDTDYHPFIGCFYTAKKKKVNKIRLIVPYTDSDITNSINIHEYTHAIILYQYINKIFPENNTTEILPMFYERLYLEENKNNALLQEHTDAINKRITLSNDPEIIKYRLALAMQDELLEYYSKGDIDIKKLTAYAKKRAKRIKL